MVDSAEKRVQFEKGWQAETIALHSGYDPNEHLKSVAVPIYQSTSFVFDSAQHGANLFDLAEEGFIYSRINNPTLDVLEKRIAALENGVGALAVSSGMAAIDYAISTLAIAGDNIISTSELYGGTHNFFKHILPNRGIETTIIDKDDFNILEKSINSKTKAIFVESVGNPSGGIADLEKISSIAHKYGVAVIVDNTVATPIGFKVFQFGADIVIHSATKYIGGHGTTIGGLIIDSGNFDWIKNKDRYPQFSDPDPSYHGISFTESFKNAAYIARVRTVLLRNTGATLAANSAFLLLQGLETLSLRLERISQNTQKILDWLLKHPKVERVDHVSVGEHQDNKLFLKYFKKGYLPGILSFKLKGGSETARLFYNSLLLFSRLVNIGDSKSLAVIPAETTHHQLSEDELENVGISPGLIRLSIGIENIDDLIFDLTQALE